MFHLFLLRHHLSQDVMNKSVSTVVFVIEDLRATRTGPLPDAIPVPCAFEISLFIRFF